MKFLNPLLILCLTRSLYSQGTDDYFNVETPQVHPIEVARVGGHDFLLVCNTPDNSIEIWDSDESLPIDQRFLRRIRVGLEPNSVRFHGPTRTVFVTNFLSDSVTRVVLSKAGGAPASNLVAIMDRSVVVGDEPMDCGFLDSPTGDLLLYVTSRTRNSLFWLNARTLMPVIPGQAELPLFDDLAEPDHIIKAPHTVLINNDLIYVLGLQGGGFPLPGVHTYDADLWIGDSVGVPIATLGKLGTNNFNMRFSSSGDLFVVGQEARNNHPDLPAMLSAETTGFVRSTLYWIQDVNGAATIFRRNLNAIDAQETTAVGFADALAQPTSVLPYEVNGEVEKLFLTAMGSDVVAALEPDLGAVSPDPYSWPIQRVKIDPIAGYRMSGPRALAIKYANSQQTNDPGDRIYCLNRLDNSLAVIDPQTDPPTVLDRVGLNHDPRPIHLVAGKPFLYNARLSGNGFVSCASCHIDGRLDQAGWNLGDPTVMNEMFPIEISDAVGQGNELDTLMDFWVNGFPSDKGLMVTQSLQGLVNYETSGEAQEWFSNQPYHWRGDREDFVAFLEAFEVDGLLEGGKVSEQEMRAFERFINTIHYPPNPHQSLNREYSGQLGDPNDLDDGQGALAGLKLFHIHKLDVCEGRSCVTCHALPEGSNNRITDILPPSGQGAQPLETPAMRGLFQKDAAHDLSAAPTSDIKSGNFGATRVGSRVSANQFVEQAFAPDLGMPAEPKMLRVKEFMRQMDWHVAPLVGFTYTVDRSNLNDARTTDVLNLFESQANMANIGVAVWGFTGGQEQAWWFDITGSLAVYTPEPNQSGGINRQALLALVIGARDRLIFVATPLGSERRVASLSGQASDVVDVSSPANVELLGLAPNSAYEHIPSFERNWDPNHANPAWQFLWAGASPTVPTVKAIRIFQHAILDLNPLPNWGLDRLRHEAPRRFRVAGDNIRPGAKLQLFVPDDDVNGPPDEALGLEQMTTRMIEISLYPTNELTSDGRSIWESAAELNPPMVYVLMMGGFKAPGVAASLFDWNDVIDEQNLGGLHDPLAWNFHYVRVVNSDSTQGDGGWQRVRMR